MKKTQLVRQALADAYPTWVPPPVIDGLTTLDVSGALSGMRTRGNVESKRSPSGGQAKLWRLVRQGDLARRGKAPEPVNVTDHAPPQEPAPIDLNPVIDGVIAKIVGEFQAQLEKRLSAALEITLATTASTAIETLPQRLFQKPAGPTRRVTVVGLLDKQASMIAHEYRAEFKLEFVVSDHYSGSRLKGLASSSEAVIVMTDFVKHAVDEVVLSVGGNLVKCPGGMTHLREKLDELFLATIA